MKAVVLKPGNQLALEDVPKPEIDGPGQILVKVTTSAICGSDLHIKNGDMPIRPGTVIGHEFVGVVEETAPDVKALKPGDRVDVAAGLWCGHCAPCKRGEVQNCRTGGVWGGGYYNGVPMSGAQTEYVRVFNAEMCCVPIPDNVSDEQAILVGDVFSTGFHGVKQSGVGPGDTMAIFGCGPIGLAAVASAGLFGPSKLFALDVLPNRLEVARQLGAETIDDSDGGGVNKLLAATDMYGLDVVVEASGATACFMGALGSIRRGGTVSVVGLFNAPVQLQLPTWGLYGVQIKMGLASLSNMNQLMSLLANGRVDLSALTTHTFPLSKAMEAYELFEQHKDKCIKVMLKP